MIKSRDLEYAKKLQKMIQVNTVSVLNEINEEKFYKFHEVLKELFPLVFSKCEITNFKGSLLIKYKGKDSSKLPIMLMAHQDVVDVSENWKHPPFSGYIDEKEETIYGRGTLDTKGSLMCIFQSFEEMLEENFVPERDIYIGSSNTEEINGPGAKFIVDYLKENNIHLDFLIDEGGAVVPNPLPGIEGLFALVGCVERGRGNYKIIAKGQGGHASIPPVNSPLVRLSRFMLDVENTKKFKVKLNDTTVEMFRRLGKKAKGINGFLLRHSNIFKPILKPILKKNPTTKALMQTSVAFTEASGSNGSNVLPVEAYVIANIRFIQHQDVEATYKILNNIAKKYDLKIEVLDESRSCPVVDYKTKEFKFLEDVVSKIYPEALTSPYPMTGATDASHYVTVCNHCFRFSPMIYTNDQLKAMHNDNEHIFLYSLSPGIDFYKEVIRQN